MFDKIVLSYTAGEEVDFSLALASLDVSKTSVDNKTGETEINGYLRGMRVRIWPACKRIKIEGSLAKFLYGENITMLTRATTREAIENLSEALGIDVGKGTVASLEFGVNIVTRHEPWAYMQRLGDMPRRERTEHTRHTLYYKHKGREQPDELTLYDKAREARKKKNRGMPIPADMRNKNILRCELSLNGRLPQQLGVPKVLASSLYEEELWAKLIGMLVGKYQSIHKNRITMIDTKRIKTERDIDRVFFSLVAKKSGVDVDGILDAVIEEMKAGNVLKNRSAYTRTKRRIKSILDSARYTEQDDLIRELDLAFHELAENPNPLY